MAQTDVAVLGALSIEPMTGYAVREQIRDVLGHFWSESFGQIYPTLRELEAEGLVRREASEREGASLYRITPAGLERLRERLAEPATMNPPRNGMLLRLFFGRHLGAEACREMVAGVRDDAVARLTTYAAIREHIAGEGAEDAPYWLMTLSAGEHNAHAMQQWAEETLEQLDELLARARTRRGRRDR
jgi:DNA-binding PadR family transcriptional regulator